MSLENQRPPTPSVPETAGAVSLSPVDFTSEAQLHTALREAFQWPDHYGHNWDALFDMLTDVAWSTEALFFELPSPALLEGPALAVLSTLEEILKGVSASRAVAVLWLPETELK